MTQTNREQEIDLRSRAADAYRYERPDAAQRPAVDTSKLWAPLEPAVESVPIPPPSSR